VSGGSGYDTQNRPPHPVWGPAQTARGWAGRNRLFSAREPPPTEAFARTIQCTRKALSRQSDSPILGWPSPALPCIACDSDASRDVPLSSILHGQIAHTKLSSSLHGHRADRGRPHPRPRPRPCPSTGTEPTEAVLILVLVLVLVLVLPRAQSQQRMSSSLHGDLTRPWHVPLLPEKLSFLGGAGANPPCVFAC